MTPAACRMMEAMGAERDALAAAFGHRLESLATFLHRANGLPLAPLADLTAAIARKRPDVLGPKTMESRYVTEDVPFGLAFYQAIAATAGIAMPVTGAVVTALEALWGRDLRRNPLLDTVDLANLPRLLRDGVGRA
jgi:opine dehydrogenase